MREALRRLLAFWSFLADTLQVAGFEWAKTAIAPLLITALTGVIGIIQGASWFSIGVAIPIVFAACLLVATLVRVWPLLRQQSLVRGIHPLLAFGLYTDPEVRKRRDDALAEQSWINGRLYLVGNRVKRFDRLRMSGALQGTPSDEEGELRDDLEELSEKKDWADIEADVAAKGLLGDFYAKLEAGALIATGLVVPHAHGAQPVVIPAVEWSFLRFGETFDEASGEGIAYRVVGVRKSHT